MGWLAVLLLLVPCVALACGVRCDLARLGPGCHAPATAHEACGMDHAGTPGVSATAKCAHTLCADTALIADDRTELALHPMAGLPFVGVLPLPAAPFRGLSGSGPPPPRTAPLQTTLRI